MNQYFLRIDYDEYRVVNVVFFSGGCRNDMKPHLQRICTPECNVPHSYCKDMNLCDCERGYKVCTLF